MLATVPGGAKLQGTASATSAKGPATPRLPQLVQIGGAKNPALAQPAATLRNQPPTPGTASFPGSPAPVDNLVSVGHSAPTAMDIALHPSLKYTGYVAAAYDVPLADIGNNTSASADAINASSVPNVPQSVATEDNRILVRRNLQMESARRFVTSMCEDHQGRLWVAADNGLQYHPEGCVECFDPSAPQLHQWTQFTTKDGLGDDTATAVACDHQGRIWVGHTGNHGVSVYNGQKWQNYSNAAIPTGRSGLLGPLGERVSHITICPTDGDVWIATDCGLTRYSDSKGTWTIYGLPAGEATSLVFDHKGNIYVATSRDGIAMANAAENYSAWRRATAPDQISPTQSGSGLPSNSINDILATEDGKIYAATDAGLAWSKDDGGGWRFIRGRDWAQNSRQQGGTPALEASQAQTGPVAMPSVVLGEDYCSCLTEAHNADTSAEQIYIGHRRSGVDLFDPAKNRITEATPPMFARAFAGAGQTYIGSYGPQHHVPYPGPGGVIALGNLSGKAIAPSLGGGARLADLPSGAPPVSPEPLDPEVEMRNLKDLYAAGHFNELLMECGRAEKDSRYSAWHPELLYLAWATDEKLGKIDDSDRLRDSFLQQYPRHIFAADMYFEQAIRLLANAQYAAAGHKLAMIDDYFPHSNIAEKARTICQQEITSQ
jgi:hypothetical protein